jgi:hypothetical protein
MIPDDYQELKDEDRKERMGGFDEVKEDDGEE